MTALSAKALKGRKVFLGNKALRDPEANGACRGLRDRKEIRDVPVRSAPEEWQALWDLGGLREYGAIPDRKEIQG